MPEAAPALRGFGATVEHLLAAGDDPDLACGDGITALFAAATEGHERVARLRLDTGVTTRSPPCCARAATAATGSDAYCSSFSGGSSAVMSMRTPDAPADTTSQPSRSSRPPTITRTPEPRGTPST